MTVHWKPSRKAVETFMKYRENALYFWRNSKKFREDYGGQIIGILDKHVWYSCKDSEEFRRKLREEPRINQVFVQYVPKENEIILYASADLALNTIPV